MDSGCWSGNRTKLDAHGNPKVFLNSMFGVVGDGKAVANWGIQSDITERLKAEEARHKAEDALRESEERYRAFVAAKFGGNLSHGVQPAGSLRSAGR